MDPASAPTPAPFHTTQTSINKFFAAPGPAHAHHTGTGTAPAPAPVKVMHTTQSNINKLFAPRAPAPAPVPGSSTVTFVSASPAVTPSHGIHTPKAPAPEPPAPPAPAPAPEPALAPQGTPSPGPKNLESMFAEIDGIPMGQSVAWDPAETELLKSVMVTRGMYLPDDAGTMITHYQDRGMLIDDVWNLMTRSNIGMASSSEVLMGGGDF
jgi:hypothetical protein